MNQLIIKSRPFNPVLSLQISSDKNPVLAVMDFSMPFCSIESNAPEKINAMEVNNKSRKRNNPSCMEMPKKTHAKNVKILSLK